VEDDHAYAKRFWKVMKRELKAIRNQFPQIEKILKLLQDKPHQTADELCLQITGSTLEQINASLEYLISDERMPFVVQDTASRWSCTADGIQLSKELRSYQ
jgi:tetrahydromethanopterin S-methyltransferase subunit H